MKLETLVKAAPALDKVLAANLDLSVAYQLRKRLPEYTKHFDFHNAELNKIKETYSGAEMNEKYRELLDFETDYDLKPLEMRLRSGIMLSVNDLIALEPFIVFKED